MRKVLIVITTSFVPYGGLTTVMMNYYRAINKDGLRIDFASTNEPETSLLDELKKNRSRYFCLGERKKNLLGYTRDLNRLLTREKYDVVHINGNSATMTFELAVAKLNRVKTRIAHNHTSVCDYQRLHKWLHPIFLRLYTDAIACSDKAGQWIFIKNKYLILNNGINTERFRYREEFRKKIRKAYGISEDSLLLGHVGKIYKPKNHQFLIEIFEEFHKNHQDSKLIIVGDGEMRQQIEAKVENVGLMQDVIFVGMQSRVEEFLSAMDVFVFPSLWEGMPLSVIEAQAAGLTCLISDGIDSAVNVTDKVNRLSIVDGVALWVEAINAIQLPDRTKQSAENIDKIKRAKYDTLLMASDLEKLYRK